MSRRARLALLLSADLTEVLRHVEAAEAALEHSTDAEHVADASAVLPIFAADLAVARAELGEARRMLRGGDA